MEEDGIKKTKSLEGWNYTAFEKWEYKPIIYKLDHDQSWVNMCESFYRGSRVLIEGVLDGERLGDVEGMAGVYLFRHYVELSFKRIILNGRWLTQEDKNAAREDVEKVARIHELRILWDWVLEDAKPKIASEVWENYDIGFVEKCISEFDAVDKKGFAFRYPGEGGERCQFNYAWLIVAMEHVEQVLDNMLTYLIETYCQNAEYQAFLDSEFGRM